MLLGTLRFTPARRACKETDHVYDPRRRGAAVSRARSPGGADSVSEVCRQDVQGSYGAEGRARDRFELTRGRRAARTLYELSLELRDRIRQEAVRVALRGV